MVDKSKSKSKPSKKNNAKTGSSLIWTVIKVLLSQSYLVIAISVAIALIPLKDFPFNAQSYDAPDFAKTLNDALNAPKPAKLSYKLDDPQITRKLFRGYPGPEAFTYGANSFFTGLADGRVMRIDEGLSKIEQFVRLSSNATAEKCDNQIHRTSECGRPLGLEVHAGKLWVIDAVEGLYSVDLATRQFVHIPVAAYLAGKLDESALNNMLYNDLRFDPVKSNLVYISVSTTKYSMGQLPYSLLEHENSGLLLAVDLEQKNGVVVGKDLYFTNGIEISSNKQHLYVSQTTTYSILKLDLKQLRDSFYGNNGQNLPGLESFISDLLGEPDNLHTKDGKLYVGFAMVRLNGPLISDHLARLPIIRNFISKGFYILSQVFHFIRQIVLENKFNYRSALLQDLESKFYSGHIVYSAVKERGGIAVYDESTKALVEVIGSNEFGFISHAFVHPKTNELLFGSFKNDFVGVIKP